VIFTREIELVFVIMNISLNLFLNIRITN